MQNRFDLLATDVMPIYMIMPRYSHNYAQFCQLLNSNSFTHRKILMLLREATSETYDPGSILIISIFITLLLALSLLCLLLFTLHLYTKNTKKYYLSSLSDLTFVSDREGIDNPKRVGCVELLFLCRYEGLERSLLLD